MNDSKQCACKGHYLVLTKRQTSHIIAGILVCNIFTFMVGYLLAKRTILQELSFPAQKDLFNNQIHYALHALQENNIRSVSLVKPNDTQTTIVPNNRLESSPIISKIEQNLSKVGYQAHLISFGSITGAQQFVNRLQRNGINTTIIKHEGTIPTQKGLKKSICWYDILTEKFEHEKHVKEIVEAVRQIVKLNEVRIVKVHDDCTSRENDQKQVL